MGLMRYLQDKFYETEPIIGRRSLGQNPEMIAAPDYDIGPGGIIRQGVRVTPDGPLHPPVDFGSDPRMGEPEEIGRRRTGNKSMFGRIMTDVLPAAVRGGIVGASTPNVAGGGPVDIMRAAGAADASYENRRDRQAHQQDVIRKRQIDDRQNEAQSRMYDAQARMYEAHADQYEAAAKGKAKGDLVNVPSGGAIFDPDTRQVVYHNGGATDKPFVLNAGQIAFDKDHKEIMRGPEKPAAKGAAAKPSVTELTNERTKIADEMKLGGDARTRYILEGKLPAPVKPEKPDKDKERLGTPGQFSVVESRKQAGFLKAKQKFNTKIQEASTNQFGGAKPLAEADRLRILQDYNDEMEMMQQAYEAEIVALGGAIGPKTPPKGPQVPQKAGPPVSTPPPSALTPNAAKYRMARKF